MNKEQQIKEMTMLICKCVKDGLATLLAVEQNKVERLQRYVSSILLCVKSEGVDVQKLQRQAVKDFAEKLKQRAQVIPRVDEINETIKWTDYIICADDLYYLLKEYEE